MKYIVALFLLLFACPALAADDSPTLAITIGAEKHVFTAEALLANAATRDITIDHDVSYNQQMHYRAIPLARLLGGVKLPADSVMEAVAKDGFVAALPTDMIVATKKDAAEAYLAIEPPAAHWPALPGKKESAGPFYIVWLHPEASGIRTEQWPYMTVELRSAVSPAKRWKELAVAKDVPADSPVRAGQALFATQCMSCHKLNGAGSADVGPDLNMPMSPTEYFKAEALKKYIRDPASLRHWNGMQMPGFSKDALSDREVDDIIAYLEQMAAQKKKP